MYVRFAVLFACALFLIDGKAPVGLCSLCTCATGVADCSSNPVNYLPALTFLDKHVIKVNGKLYIGREQIGIIPRNYMRFFDSVHFSGSEHKVLLFSTTTNSYNTEDSRYSTVIVQSVVSVNPRNWLYDITQVCVQLVAACISIGGAVVLWKLKKKVLQVWEILRRQQIVDLQ
jgi:hypothetical protein